MRISDWSSDVCSSDLEATDRADDVVVGNFDGHALVRGAQLAFAGEPELAAHIVCDRTVREPDTAATEAALAAGALSPPIDLLQYDFARTPPRRPGWPAWRRATRLAGMLRASSEARRVGKAGVSPGTSRWSPYL